MIVFAGSRNFNALSNCQPMRGVDLYLTSKAIKARARSPMDGRARVNWTDWSLHAEVSRLANIRDGKRVEKQAWNLFSKVIFSCDVIRIKESWTRGWEAIPVSRIEMLS